MIIDEKIENSIGHIASYRIENLKTVLEMFASNYELFIKTYETNPALLIVPVYSEKYFKDTMKQFSIFIIFAVLLYEHTVEFRKDYEDEKYSEFSDLYIKKINEYYDLGLSSFIKGLRNYIIHHKIPASTVYFK